MGLLFSGMSDLLYRLDEMGGDLKAAVEEMLEETFTITQDDLKKAASTYKNKGGGKGYTTGEMYKAIKTRDESYIEWESATKASIHVGFNIYDPGGWESIFIMYGTPKFSKNQAVFNVFKGNATRKKIYDAQQKIIRKYLGWDKPK